MAVEPTCLALLALRSKNVPGAEILIHTQRDDSGWGAFEGDDESSGLAGLVLLTLNTLGASERACDRAANWLLQTRGREADWSRKWKFRTTDTRVCFDPGKFGWPWQPGACSWIVPTAFALLALKQSFPCHRPRRLVLRLRRGIGMLLDRACPGGGWNAGNGVVYRCPMVPHIDATAIALLALQGERLTEIIKCGLAGLEHEASACQTPWSLAWSILALHSWTRPVNCLQQHLTRLAESDPFDDTATLAVTILALDCSNLGNPFKVLS